MASKGKIDEIVDIKACQDQLIKLNAMLGVTLKNVEDIAVSAQKMNAAFKNAKGLKETTQAQVNLNKVETERLIVGEKLKQQIIQTEKAEIALTNAKQKAAEKTEKQIGEYKKLSDQLNKARENAKNLAAQYGINDQRAKDAAKGVQQLDSKIKEIDKSLGQHQRNVGNYRDVWTKVTTVIGGAIGVFAAGGVAMKAFNAVIASTDSTMDWFEQQMSGIKEATGLFLRSVATADFSNLIQGMRDAFSEGKRYSSVLDELEDRQRSLGIQKDDIETQIIQQRIIAKNRQNDLETRKAAVDEIIRLEQMKLDKTKEITQKTLQNELESAAFRSKMSKEEVEDFIKNWDTYAEKLEEGAKLQAEINAIQTEVRTTRTGFSYIDDSKRIEFINKLTDAQRENLELNKKANLITAEKRDLIAAALRADIGATNELLKSEEELARIRNGLYSEFLQDQKDNTEAKRTFVNLLELEIKKAQQLEQIKTGRPVITERTNFEGYDPNAPSKTELEFLEETEGMKVQLAWDTFDALQSITNSAFQNKLMQLDAEAKADEEAKAAELQRAGNNAALKDQIEAKYAKKAKDRDKERIDIQRKQAIFNKSMAVGEIGIKTAQAIAKTIAEWGMPFATPFVAMAAAMGALQIATVLATPIPKYFKGREGGKAEFAIVGDRGQEAIQTKDGEYFLTPNKPTLTFLPEHAKVITNEKLKQAAEAMSFNSFMKYGPQPEKEVNIDKLIDVIKNKKEYHINITEKGLQAAAMRGASITQYINQNIRL